MQFTANWNEINENNIMLIRFFCCCEKPMNLKRHRKTKHVEFFFYQQFPLLAACKWFGRE